MKRSLVLLLSFCVLFGLSACENDDTTNADASGNVSQTETTELSTESLGEASITSVAETSESTNLTSTRTSITDTTSNEISKCSSNTKRSAHSHVYSKATCIQPAKCSCGVVQGLALGHDYVDGKCSRCGRIGGKIEITLENWDKYFEVYEWVDWNLNAFGEPTEFFGIRISFNLKSEYRDKCSADVACEYLISQSHCIVAYDVQSQTCNIGEPMDYFNEHSSTLNGGAYESYISFSLGDRGTTKGSYTMEKYNFVKMLRVQGTLELLE